MTQTRTPSPIDALAENYFEELLKLAPEEATMLGRPGVETLYRDYSPAGREAIAELHRDTLAQLNELEPVDSVDRVTVEAMRERLGVELALHETGRTELNNLASDAHGIRMVLELMPQSTDEDFTHIAGRLQNIPAALEQYWESLQDSRAKGQVAAVRQVKAVAAQAASWAQPDGALSTLLTAAQTAGASAAVEEQVRRGVESAAGSYQRFAERLTEQLLPDAPERDAVGALSLIHI